MRHLQSVPGPHSPAAPSQRHLFDEGRSGLRSANPHDLPPGATQPALELPGLPELHELPETAGVVPAPGSPGPWFTVSASADPAERDDPEDLEPQVAAAIAQAESLFDDVDPSEWLQVAAGFYIDADGTARTRHGMLRSL